MQTFEDFINNSNDNTIFSVFFVSNLLSDNAGSIKLDKNIFDNVLHKSVSLFGKYKKTSEILYYDNNKILSKLNGKDIFFKEISKNDSYLDKEAMLLYVKKEYNILTHEDFVFKNKYHDICKQNKMIFNTQIGQLYFITESYENKKCSYFLELTFTKKDMGEQYQNKLNDLITTIKYHIKNNFK